MVASFFASLPGSSTSEIRDLAPISEELEVCLMARLYFRKKYSFGQNSAKEWIQMTGREFYQFVSAPENAERRFIDMGNVVLEAPDSIYREYKSELDHSDYLKEQEKGWSTVSISSLEGKDILSGEDAIADHTQNVETEAVQLLLLEKLRVAIKSVSDTERWIISELYLAKPPKTLRQLSAESGIPVMTLQNKKKKALENIRKNFF